MRAAMVGGTAYAVGKHVQSGRDQDAGEDAPPAAEEAAAAPPSGVLGDAAIAELQKLAELQKAGVLTQEEFDEQKRKLLQGA
jgi:hypothetical protein